MMNGYEPRDFAVGGRDVKSGWIVVLMVNIGLVILSL